ncbi:MAG: hypothetical protein JW722_00415 [Demequinaceae bacterium]|nr:hypothetical protein [Demequinaceae bacterium]
MNEALVLPPELLPSGFKYPVDFLRFLELDVREFDPWNVLVGDLLVRRSQGLRERYPDSSLVPFATRYDRDDIACFDLVRGNNAVIRIHDFASPGWERRDEYGSFREWLHVAMDDALDF